MNKQQYDCVLLILKELNSVWKSKLDNFEYLISCIQSMNNEKVCKDNIDMLNEICRDIKILIRSSSILFERKKVTLKEKKMLDDVYKMRERYQERWDTIDKNFDGICDSVIEYWSGAEGYSPGF